MRRGFLRNGADNTLPEARRCVCQDLGKLAIQSRIRRVGVMPAAIAAASRASRSSVFRRRFSLLDLAS